MALLLLVVGVMLAGAAHGGLAGGHPNLPVPGASHFPSGTVIGGFQGLSVALIGLGLAWRLGGARATRGERPT